jgi:predicted Na+-dependent transporter
MVMAVMIEIKSGGCMKFHELIEKYSNPILISGLLIGAATDAFSRHDFLIRYILMFMMFLSFLKIDFKRIIHYCKRPWMIATISIVQMFLFPALFYLVLSRFVSGELAVVVLLLFSLPSAILSPVLTGMFKGEVNLSVVLVVVNYIIAVFSIPFLFYVLVGKELSLNLNLMAYSLFEMIIIPMVLAAVVLYKFDEKVRKIDPYFNSISIICVFFIIIFALSPQHEYIFNNLLKCLNILVFQFFIFASLFIFYWLPLRLEKDERRTVTITKCFMNNMLGIVLAVEFFGPFDTLFMALTEIMWVLMFVVSKKIYA